MFENLDIQDDTDLWRGVILHGKNASTYKIALGQLLINYSNRNFTKIPLDELAQDFYHTYQKRMEKGLRQNKTSGRDTYVEQMVNEVKVGKTKESNALDFIKENALKNMVLQRFNTICGKKIPEPFYTFDDRNLMLSNNVLEVFTGKQNSALQNELNSRWDLLEHAFTESNAAATLELDEKLEWLIHTTKRTNITSFIDVLQGYQQGKCFYCGDEMDGAIEVDHVIPRQALGHDEVWNLVLAHKFCNQDKSDNLPPKPFIEALFVINEYVMDSNLPLREHLRLAVKKTPAERWNQIQEAYKFANKKIGDRFWGGNKSYDPRENPHYKRVRKIYDRIL